MPVRKIFLLRHGEVAGAPALYGRTDAQLSDKGFAQLKQQCASLPPISEVVCSPLQRCCGFAQQLATEYGLKAHVNAGFQEMDFGLYDGKPYESLSGEDWQKLELFWHDPRANTLPQAESLRGMYQRVSGAWQTLLSDQDSGATLVVTHGGVIRLLIAHILNIDWCNPSLYSQLRIGYASLTLITQADYKDAQPAIEYIGKPVAYSTKDDE